MSSIFEIFEELCNQAIITEEAVMVKHQFVKQMIIVKQQNPSLFSFTKSAVHMASLITNSKKKVLTN